MNQEDKILKLLLEMHTLFKEEGYYSLCREQLSIIKEYINNTAATRAADKLVLVRD